jgi:hypothetical protein
VHSSFSVPVNIQEILASQQMREPPANVKNPQKKILRNRMQPADKRQHPSKAVAVAKRVRINVPEARPVFRGGHSANKKKRSMQQQQQQTAQYSHTKVDGGSSHRAWSNLSGAERVFPDSMLSRRFSRQPFDEEVLAEPSDEEQQVHRGQAMSGNAEAAERVSEVLQHMEVVEEAIGTLEHQLSEHSDDREKLSALQQISTLRQHHAFMQQELNSTSSEYQQDTKIYAVPLAQVVPDVNERFRGRTLPEMLPAADYVKYDGYDAEQQHNTTATITQSSPSRSRLNRSHRRAQHTSAPPPGHNAGGNISSRLNSEWLFKNIQSDVFHNTIDSAPQTLNAESPNQHADHNVSIVHHATL